LTDSVVKVVIERSPAEGWDTTKDKLQVPDGLELEPTTAGYEIRRPDAVRVLLLLVMFMIQWVRCCLLRWLKEHPARFRVSSSNLACEVSLIMLALDSAHHLLCCCGVCIILQMVSADFISKLAQLAFTSSSTAYGTRGALIKVWNSKLDSLPLSVTVLLEPAGMDHHSCSACSHCSSCSVTVGDRTLSCWLLCLGAPHFIENGGKSTPAVVAASHYSVHIRAALGASDQERVLFAMVVWGTAWGFVLVFVRVCVVLWVCVCMLCVYMCKDDQWDIQRIASVSSLMSALAHPRQTKPGAPPA